MSKYKITGREILFSTIIICAMVGLGVWISNPILRSSTESAMKVTSSVKVNDNEKFTYICRTNVGDFLAEGTLKAIDPVSIDELEGQYVCYELNRIIKNNMNKLKGIVDIYPALNPLGIDSIQRGIPMFDLDMNRIFPGNENGAMADKDNSRYQWIRYVH